MVVCTVDRSEAGRDRNSRYGLLPPRASAPSGGEDGADDGLVSCDLDQSERAGVVEREGAGGEAEDAGGIGADGGVCFVGVDG